MTRHTGTKFCPHAEVEGGGREGWYQHPEVEGEVGERPSGQPRRNDIMRIVEQVSHVSKSNASVIKKVCL